LYVGLSDIRRAIHKYACKPALFRTRCEPWGYDRRHGEREDLWFPRGTRRSVVDYARGGRGEAKGDDKINRSSLSLVESSPVHVNVDLMLTEAALHA